MGINLLRELPFYVGNNDLAKGKVPDATLGLAGKSILIIGKRNIGVSVGGICDALKMDVHYFERGNDLIEKTKDKKVLVNCLSSNETSKNILNKYFFDSLTLGSYFVSVSSNEVYDMDSMFNDPQDVDDILHYINALKYGMKRFKDDDFLIYLRFIKELHLKLIDKARATQFSNPGEFRKIQNWIGGTRLDNARFAPPSLEEMKIALADFEKFLYSDEEILTLIKTGIIHAQFQTIHPFLDGNGRTGRMLIAFYLWKEKFLDKPVLFLSLYFKCHQELYYEKLTAYHNENIFDWVGFFLDGIIEIAQEAIVTVEKITKLRDGDIQKIQKLRTRALESAVIIFSKLYGQAIVNVSNVQGWTGYTRAEAQRVTDCFIQIGIFSKKDEEVKYGQSYVYKK